MEALGDEINSFIGTSLYGISNKVCNENTAPNAKPQITKNINRNKNNNCRNNRNARRKYSYARCQELFHECPKKLADVVVNNDSAYLEPARQLPNAVEVKRFYEGL